MGSVYSEEGFELTAAGYARSNGLSTNHLAEPLPISHIENLQSTVSYNLTEDGMLTHINYPIDVNIDEHLTIDKSAARLIQCASNGPCTREELNFFVTPQLDIRNTRKLRVETPLLKTDHESDCRYFAVKEYYHFQDGDVPVEPLDDEMDEGLIWPQRLKDLPDNLLKELKAEKTEILKENFVYLQATIKESWGLEDEEAVWHSANPYKKNPGLQPVTPPLLPMSPPSIPYIPSSPACHLPLLSDPASLISDDVRNIENEIFGQDSLIPPENLNSPPPSSKAVKCMTVKPSDIFTSLDDLDCNGHIFIPSYTKSENRKVEVPLLPLRPTLMVPKPETISETIGEMLLDQYPKISQPRSPSFNSDDVHKFFEEAFRGPADAANRVIEQEQLKEPDTKMRVEVPIMDFSQPTPPWKAFEQARGRKGLMTKQNTMMRTVQHECIGIPPWPGTNALVQKLRWSVFPSELARLATDESFGNEDVAKNLLDNTRYEVVIDSGGLTWKPPGLRILKEDYDDDDDLEPGFFDAKEYHDMESLVRKRKIRYDEGKPDKIGIVCSKTSIRDIRFSQATPEDGIDVDLITQGQGATSNSPNPNPKQQHIKKPSFLLDDAFSPADAIDNFLEIRASKKQKAATSAYFMDGPSTKKLLVATGIDQTSSKETIKVNEPKVLHHPLPVPSIDPPPTPTPFIISSQVLRHRLLIRTIQGLFPSAMPIERDFTAHNTTAWLPNSISRSPITSSLASEADIIVSPSTGIILTSLQKIKQKPLPGQKAQPALKGRIEKVSERYERLVLLVSEANTDESTNSLNRIDTTALADLTGFCSSLCARTTVQFVGGGDETLGKWLAAVMIKYSAQGEASVPLLEEETLWELFLRRVGLNAYASQAIIAALKAPEGVDINGTEAGFFGISAFVKMEMEERVRRFGELLGGDKVLRRVGKVLDVRWS